MNQVAFVGRITNDPKIEELENGKKVCNINLAIGRTYKNADGEYGTDFVDCVLWDDLGERTVDYCRKGDLVGLKGRVETNNYEKDGEKRKSTKVVAERISFLSNQKVKEDEIVKDVTPNKKQTKDIENEM